MNFFSSPFPFLTYVYVITSCKGGTKCDQPFWIALQAEIGNFNPQKSEQGFLGSLGSILSLPDKGFECATGAAALTAQLAELYHLAGDRLRALRLRQLSSIYGAYGLQTQGQERFDSSIWPISWKQTIDSALKSMVWYKSSAAHSDGAGISDQRVRKSDVRIAIVTVCDYDTSVTPLARLSLLNKRRYATIHKHELVFFDRAPVFKDYFTDNGRMNYPVPHAWRKIDALMEVMADDTKHFDWIMWMDCDSYFMNENVELSGLIAVDRSGQDTGSLPSEEVTARIRRLKNWIPNESVEFDRAVSEFRTLARSLVEPVTGRTEFIASEDGLMLNTGVFFVRKSVFAFHFLWQVRALLFNSSRITSHPWWEQTGIMMLISAPFLANDMTWESVKLNRGFAPFVRMHSQKDLNGYPPLIAGMLSTHTCFETGDFIVSFSGCKSYTSQAVCNDLFRNYYAQSCLDDCELIN